jgi:hypothetical protein
MKLSEKQERWIQQLEELWNFFDARLKNYSLKTNDLRFGLLLHMTVAVHRLIRGFLAQLKGGSNDFLESRLRTLVEAGININYILADETGNRARAFILDGTRSRLTALKRIPRLLEQKKAPAMEEVNTIESYKELKLSLEQELSAKQNLLGKENATWPNLEQRAKGGNSEELYATVFWLFSEDTHMAAEGLNRYLRNIEGGIAMTTELDLSALDQQIQTAYVSYIAFINTCSQRFGFPSEEELKEFNSSEMLPKQA